MCELGSSDVPVPRLRCRELYKKEIENLERRLPNMKKDRTGRQTLHRFFTENFPPVISNRHMDMLPRPLLK